MIHMYFTLLAGLKPYMHHCAIALVTSILKLKLTALTYLPSLLYKHECMLYVPVIGYRHRHRHRYSYSYMDMYSNYTYQHALKTKSSLHTLRTADADVSGSACTHCMHPS